MIKIKFGKGMRTALFNRFRWLSWVVAMGCVMAAAVAGGAEDSQSRKIVAVYGEAISLKPVGDGWLFEVAVESEDGAGFSGEEMVRIEQSSGNRRSVVYGEVGEQGEWLSEHPHFRQGGYVHSVRDGEGRTLWTMVSYTLQEDTSGDLWLTNGNFSNRHFRNGVVVRIYRNDELLRQLHVPMGPEVVLFQQGFGPMKKGDVIRVAVAPDEGGRSGGGMMQFTLEEFETGTLPGDPVKINLGLAIDESAPRRSPDGGYADYARQHRTQCQLVLERQPELVFIGDSITARWPQEMLDEHFGEYRPVNLGIGGDWIQNVLWRVENGVLDQVEINTIVLLIGTNNIVNRFTVEEIVAGTKSLLAVIQRVSPESRILLLGILPRAGAANDKVFQINPLLAEMADNQRVFYLDVGPAIVEADGSILPEVMPDGLHVAMPGYIRWMDAMKPKLSEILQAGDKDRKDGPGE